MGAVSKYIRIEAPPQQVYELWRDPTSFADFMPDVRSVEVRGDRWHWEVEGPGVPVEFDTEVVEDIPGQRLAWRSVGGQVATEGAVRFDARGEETDLEYSMHYEPPAGKVGEIVAKLFADPEDSVQRSLEAFKKIVERDARPRSDARTEVDAGEAAPPSHGG
jgi:uncharacterized membrane protein